MFVVLIGFSVDIGVKVYLRGMLDMSGLRAQVTRYKVGKCVRVLAGVDVRWTSVVVVVPNIAPIRRMGRRIFGVLGCL